MVKPEKRKRKRKKRQFLVLEEYREESPSFANLVQAMEELEKEGKLVDIQGCSKYKSP